MNDRDYQYMEPPAEPNAAEPFLSSETPVSHSLNVRYCRNCGKRVEAGASVCVHCNYVLDAATLQRAQRMQRIRYEQAQRQAKRNRGLLGAVSDVLTKVLIGDQPKAQNQTKQNGAQRKNYLYHTVGACYCSACGTRVEEGAVVCVRCGFVINPLAVQQAQIMVADRNAKLRVSDVIKSLLIPRHGKRVYQTYALRRPQIAKTCRALGWINSALIAGLIIGLGWWLFF